MIDQLLADVWAAAIPPDAAELLRGLAWLVAALVLGALRWVCHATKARQGRTRLGQRGHRFRGTGWGMRT